MEHLSDAAALSGGVLLLADQPPTLREQDKRGIRIQGQSLNPFLSPLPPLGTFSV